VVQSGINCPQQLAIINSRYNAFMPRSSKDQISRQAPKLLYGRVWLQVADQHWLALHLVLLFIKHHAVILLHASTFHSMGSLRYILAITSSNYSEPVCQLISLALIECACFEYIVVNSNVSFT